MSWCLRASVKRNKNRAIHAPRIAVPADLDA
jgi:hypothetical protein